MSEIKSATFEEALAESEHWMRTRGPFQKGLREGRVEGMRGALALVFELRGLQPTAAEQATIDDCADLDRLARWCQRAKTAECVAEIFD